MSVKRAMVCAPLMPEFDRESGSRRIFDLIMFLREDGWAVSFVAENGRGGERYAHMLQQRGVAVYSSFGAHTERLIRYGRLDLALFAFWHLAEAHIPSVRRLSPETRIVVDTIDLHFVRNARRLFQPRPADPEPGGGSPEGPPAAPGLDQKYASEMARELNAYAFADAVLTVSRKEADLIADLCGDPSLVRVVPDSEDLLPSPVPVADRAGVVFLGNFRHPPNVQAAEFLCNEVVPLVAPDLLDRHPIYVVGNGLNDQVYRLGRDRPYIRMVGWVPSVLPYLERARLSVIPLRYGAGTKRKLLQTLLLGTPAVSTNIGVEGLDLRDNAEVLIADDPRSFAEAVTRLLTDNTLWEQLSQEGRRHIAGRHGHDVARTKFMAAVNAVIAKPPKRTTGPDDPSTRLTGVDAYRRVVEGVRRIVPEHVPADSTVVVISRGDPELLDITGRKTWHFPRDESGLYAGHYPADSAAAIDHLEALRSRGAEFLVVPATAAWWLDHYADFGRHLRQRYREVFCGQDACMIFDLRRPGDAAVPGRVALELNAQGG